MGTMVETFDPMPSRHLRVDVSVATHPAGKVTPAPAGSVLGVPVAESGDVPPDLGVDRAALAAAGFAGQVGQTLVLPRPGGPALVAVGIGEPGGARPRDRCATRRPRSPAPAPEQTALAHAGPDPAGMTRRDAAQAAVEGVLLARYRYGPLKRQARGRRRRSADPRDRGRCQRRAPARGARAGSRCAGHHAGPRPGQRASDQLTAARMAEVAAQLGAGRGLEVEVFDEEQLIEMGCGGLLGVNARQRRAAPDDQAALRPGRRRPAALALVGKGIMYDSGGISLKPSDESHAQMKNDMTGAARDPRRDDRAAGARLHDRGDRLPDVHRQHAVRHRDEARRRAHHAQRQDGRGAQHRRRGPPGDGRRAGAGRRGAASTPSSTSPP